MTRFALSMAALVCLFTEPLSAGWQHSVTDCTCVHSYSVYPASGGYGRRLPGQWWDDGGRYISAPPANQSYGHVDNSHKPWSLIPGDGYVGSSVPKVSKDDEDDDSDSDLPKASAPTPDMSVPPDPDPAFKDPSSAAKSDTKAPAKEEEKSGAKSKADEDFDRELDRLLSPRKGEDPRKSDQPPNRRKPEENRAAPSSSSNLPPTPASAGLGLGLFTFAMIALGFSGHYVRKTWRRPENEVPVMTI